MLKNEAKRQAFIMEALLASSTHSHRLRWRSNLMVLAALLLFTLLPAVLVFHHFRIHTDQNIPTSTITGRDLYDANNIPCTLSTTLLKFQFNLTSGLFHGPVAPYNGRPGYSQNRSRNSIFQPWDHGHANWSQWHLNLPDGAVFEFRACWCSQKLARPVDYCPSQFDSCVIRTKTSEVECITTTGSTTFVQSFWPVLIFWILALAYALICSEPGGSAREFMRRKCYIRCCRSHISDDQQLAMDVETLLTRQPERAAFFYRQALLRERREQYLQAMAAAQMPNSALETSTDPIPTLRLRTKVYRPSNSSGRETNVRRIHNHATPSFPMAGSRTSRSILSEGTSTASHWLLPSKFRREHITLDEMDDEMEQGARCAICLTRLDPGDVIGDIPCHHVFHKECLKDWLRLKNRCPLCQRPDIAAFFESPAVASPNAPPEEAESDSSSASESSA